MASLKNLDKLMFLNLSGDAVGDAGIQILSQYNLPQLQSLPIGNTRITDRAVPYLAKFKQLRDLNLRTTALSPAAVEFLKKELPGANIAQ